MEETTQDFSSSGSTDPEIDYEDDPTHKEPWEGVCLTCWGVGDGSKKRVRWVHWMEKGKMMDAHLCKPCWKSLKVIIKGRSREIV